MDRFRFGGHSMECCPHAHFYKFQYELFYLLLRFFSSTLSLSPCMCVCSFVWQPNNSISLAYCDKRHDNNNMWTKKFAIVCGSMLFWKMIWRASKKLRSAVSASEFYWILKLLLHLLCVALLWYDIRSLVTIGRNIQFLCSVESTLLINWYTKMEISLFPQKDRIFFRFKIE